MAKTALLSVYDKTGIVEFAKELVAMDWEVLASGGTAEALIEGGITVRNVADLVGGGAILGHRVVTLSREIHAGLMARPIREDLDELSRLTIPYIDLACVDLYPLSDEIAKADSTPNSVLEKTDVGGPTLLRSAAKGRRIVISRPSQRAGVLEWMKQGQPDEVRFRNDLAAAAEAVVAEYALESARYTSNDYHEGVVATRALEAKYGENGWQTPAALYRGSDQDSLALHHFKVVGGSEPSYNNLVDIDRLLQTLTHIAATFDVNVSKVPAIAVGVKHGNPCGAAVDESAVEAIQKMVMGDPRAIFGGLVMINRPVGMPEAEALVQHGIASGRRLLDGIIAPEFSEEAIEFLARKGGRCRLLANPALAELSKQSLDTARRLRQVRGGFVAQPNYTQVLDLNDPTLLTSGELRPGSRRDVLLAWGIGCTSNSNTVTLVKNGGLIGNGVGQQDRVGCCELAIKRATDAGHTTDGAAAYSDSFFPFPDGPEVLAEAGVTTIFATSGSVRDEEVRQLCHKRNITLVQLPDAQARGFYNH